MVITPGGHRDLSTVHEVSLETVLKWNENNMSIVDTKGKEVKSVKYDHCSCDAEPYMPAKVVLPPGGDTGFKSGWITHASWNNLTGSPVTFFSTTWRVPPMPISKQTPPGGHRVVFLFNGAQTSSCILQPVLQYGGSGLDGTGDFWCVAIWYCVPGQVFRSKFVPVNPGDEITGMVTSTGSATGRYVHEAEFQGIAGASLTIRDAPELTSCCVALEAYGILGASSYPTIYRTQMRHIRLQTVGGGSPPLTWTVANAISDCGQHTVVVDNSSIDGEVDLCYGNVALPSSAAACWAPGRMDLFALGPKCDLYHKYWEKCVQGWGRRDWDPLDGFLNSDPVVIAWGPDRLDVFGLGRDNALWHKWWVSCEWSPWENLGGVLHSPPAVCSWGPNRLDVFGLGTDHQMFHKAWNGSSWGNWEALGGVFNSPPAVVCWGPNRIDIFGLGTDNSMYHKSWSGAWGPSQTGWNHIGGYFNSPPTVCSWAANRFDIFGLGTDNACYHKCWAGAWYPAALGWEKLGGVFHSAVQAVSWSNNRIDIVGLGTDRCCYHMAWGGNAWSSWNKISDIAMNSAPSLVTWGPNRLDLFALGPKNEMRHKSWNGSMWIPVPAQTWKDLGPIRAPPPCLPECTTAPEDDASQSKN